MEPAIGKWYPKDTIVEPLSLGVETCHDAEDDLVGIDDIPEEDISGFNHIFRQLTAKSPVAEPRNVLN
jgi:hypothetical protein